MEIGGLPVRPFVLLLPSVLLRLSFYICPHLKGVVEEVGGFLIFVLVSVDEGQNVEHRRHVGVIVTGRLLQIFQRLERTNQNAAFSEGEGLTMERTNQNATS